MTMPEDFAYGDADPNAYQRGFIDGVESSQDATVFGRRVEALKAAIDADSDLPLAGTIDRSERIIKAATMFERYLETGK